MFYYLQKKLLLIVSAFNWECPQSSLTNLFWSITCALALVLFELHRKWKWMNLFTTVASVSAFVSLHFSTSALLCCSPFLFFFFFFWELRCFFAIKAQRNQSVSVSLEQERKAKVYESGAAGATTNGLVMHLLYDNRVAGNTLLGSALLRRSTIRYEASLLQSTTKGAVWFHSAQTTESQVRSVTFLPLLEDATLLMEHTNKLLTHHVWPRVQNKL